MRLLVFGGAVAGSRVRDRNGMFAPSLGRSSRCGLDRDDIAETIAQQPLVEPDRLEDSLALPAFDRLVTAAPPLSEGSARKKLLRLLADLLAFLHRRNLKGSRSC